MLAADDDAWAADNAIDAIEIVAEPEGEPRGRGAPVRDDVEALLADAARRIETGIAAREEINSYDAYKSYEDYEREESPNFAAAADQLLEANALDASGRSHSLRARWYERVEHQWYPRTARETAKAWERALACDANNLEWIRRTAFAYLRAGKGNKALPLLSKLVAADESDAHNYFLRGLCYSDGGKWDRALRELGQAIELDPTTRASTRRARRSATTARSRRRPSPIARAPRPWRRSR